MGELYVNIEHAEKRFKEQTVLSDVCMEIEKGTICGLTGRNGSGKTVLFRSICGLLHLTSGKITVNGKQVGKDMEVPENIGILIEEPGFLQNYSGIKNLQFLAMIKGKVKKKELCEVMRMVGLNPDNRSHVGKYSLGMRQRLGIAQAIMEKPELLILDEPMNGLDNSGVQDIRKLLDHLREQGTTMLIASHNKEDIDVLCDRVYAMDGGCVQKVR